MSDEPFQAPPTHLEEEAIAAFLDGDVGSAERQEVVSHLAECEACYETFAETARFLRQAEAAAPAVPAPWPAPALRTPSRPRRTAIFGALLAAAAALVLVVLTPLGDGLLRRSADLRTTTLLAALPPAAELAPALHATWEGHGWSTARGAGPAAGPREQRSFQLGVRVLETELALTAGDRALAANLSHRVEALLEALDSRAVLTLYAEERGIRDRLRAGEATGDLLPLSRDADRILSAPARSHLGSVDPFWYAFGKWAQAGRLAARTGSAGFFTDGPGAGFVDDLQKRGLPADLAAGVDHLAATLERRPLDLPAVEDQLAALVTTAGGGAPPPP